MNVIIAFFSLVLMAAQQIGESGDLCYSVWHNWQQATNVGAASRRKGLL